MHILYICHEYPPGRLVGGIGIFTKNLAKALVKAGHQVTVVGMYRMDEELKIENDEGVKVVRVGPRPRLVKLTWLLERLRMHRIISGIVKKEKVDIVESSDYDAGFWLSPNWHIPKVVRINGGEVYFRNLLNEKLKLKHKYMETRSIRQADALAAVGNFSWRQSKRLFNLKDEEVEILPNPVDMDYFKPNPDIKVIPNRIIYTGTFIRKKGVLDLFASLPKVFRTIPDAHIICIGSDSIDKVSGKSTMETAMDLLPKEFHNRVEFTGRIPNEDILPHLQRSQVCVYPSHLETQGIVWVEAMACEKPVVASSMNTGPEIIEDGKSGLLVDPADHEAMADRIITVLKDDELAKRLGKAARERAVKHFSTEVMVPRNLNWYSRVIREYKEEKGK